MFLFRDLVTGIEEIDERVEVGDDEIEILGKEKSELELKIQTLQKQIEEKKKLHDYFSKTKAAKETVKAVTNALIQPDKPNDLPFSTKKIPKTNALPLISMPKADENLTFLNRLPKITTEEEENDEKAIQTVLGITTAQMKSLKEKGKLSRKRARFGPALFEKRQKHEEDFHILQQPILRGKRSKTRAKHSASNHAYLGKHRTKICRKCQSFPSHSKSKTSHQVKQNLKSRLKRSLELINRSQNNIQTSIFEVRNTIPVNEVRARLFLKKYGARYLENLLFRIENSRLVGYFKKWKNIIEFLKEIEIKQEFDRAQGSVKFKRVYKGLVKKRQFNCLETWNDIVVEVKKTEEGIKQTSAVIILQCWFRQRLARDTLVALKREEEQRRRVEAAIVIQSFRRGLNDIRLFTLMLEIKRQKIAAIKLQRSYKAYKFRKIIFSAITALKSEVRATVLIQCKYRQREAKKVLQGLIEEREQKAAVYVQSIIRRKLVAKVVAKAKRQRLRKLNALEIQRVFRGFKARLWLERDKRRRAIELKFRTKACLTVQRVYRGYRGRRIFKAKVLERIEKFKADEQKVIRVQSVVRGILGRKRATAYIKQITERNVKLSRNWLEVYDDRRNRYLFQNLLTNDIKFKPPRTGYTDIRGMLVLQDGRNIEDPEVVKERERIEKLDSCVECEKLPATRNCRDCHDIYCTDCFVKVHQHGKLKVHTYVWIQDGKITGENLNFYENQVEEEPTNSPTIETSWTEMFDEQENKPFWYNSLTGESTWYNPYIPSNELHNYYPEYETNTDTVAASDWEQYVDEATGEAYWYNTKTQESSWDPPLIDSWQELVDEGTNQPYWYNTVTGEASWSKPS